MHKKFLYNLPPHLKSVAKFECSTVQLYNTVIHFKSDTGSFIYSKRLQKCNVLDHTSMQINLEYYSIWFKIFAIGMHARFWLVHAACQWMRRWRVVQCCANYSAGDVAKYSADVKIKCIMGIQKKILSLSKTKILASLSLQNEIIAQTNKSCSAR